MNKENFNQSIDNIDLPLEKLLARKRQLCPKQRKCGRLAEQRIIQC